MANKPHQKRNDEIVRLHDLDSVVYSFANLAKRYKNEETGKPLSRSTVHEIYMREKAKMGDKKAKSSGVVKSKYPALAPRENLIQSTIDRHVIVAKQILAEPEIAKIVRDAGGEPAVIARAKRNIVDQLLYEGISDIGNLIDHLDQSKISNIDEYRQTVKKAVSEAVPQKRDRQVPN